MYKNKKIRCCGETVCRSIYHAGDLHSHYLKS